MEGVPINLTYLFFTITIVFLPCFSMTSDKPLYACGHNAFECFTEKLHLANNARVICLRNDKSFTGTGITRDSQYTSQKHIDHQLNTYYYLSQYLINTWIFGGFERLTRIKIKLVPYFNGYKTSNYDFHNHQSTVQILDWKVWYLEDLKVKFWSVQNKFLFKQFLFKNKNSNSFM